jgi:hypothetical protein
MDARLTEEEQQLIEVSFEPFADNLRETFQDDPRPDATRFYLFDDLSLYIRTNAGPELWADAQVFVVERILPTMRLTRLEADLMREIGMDDHVDEVRDDFFAAFARIVSQELDIQWSEARERWYHFCQSSRESDRLELGGYRQGEAEAREYLEWIKTIN